MAVCWSSCSSISNIPFLSCASQCPPCSSRPRLRLIVQGTHTLIYSDPKLYPATRMPVDAAAPAEHPPMCNTPRPEASNSRAHTRGPRNDTNQNNAPVTRHQCHVDFELSRANKDLVSESFRWALVVESTTVPIFGRTLNSKVRTSTYSPF